MLACCCCGVIALLPARADAARQGGAEPEKPAPQNRRSVVLSQKLNLVWLGAVALGVALSATAQEKPSDFATQVPLTGAAKGRGIASNCPWPY